jgi:hypothetical protein
VDATGQEESMRKLSTAAVAMILAIAFYFTIFWGFDALRMLTSPTYGLEEVWRSQFIFEIGRLFALSPLGLIKLAAFFAVLKLAVAAICAVHIVDRFRSLAGRTAETEVFETALMLVALIAVASIGPAIWMHNGELVRQQAVYLLLAGVAAGFGIVERNYRRRTGTTKPAERADKLAVSRGANWYRPFH